VSPAGLRRAALLLGLCALLALGVLSAIERLTRQPIEEARAQARREALAVVLPQDRYDNDPLADTVQIRAPLWLGRGQPVQVWRGRLGGEDSGLALEASAPDGYSGRIDLLIGVDAEGRVLGVQVTEHAETPGLGDPIERGRSDWIESFEGRSIGDPPLPQWTVRREGGEFDQFAGATISPRAVVKAVARALALLERERAAIMAAEVGTTLEYPSAPPEPL
jgi:Na+-translocating ferredoxin:NAD+ oxidoreductase subunit G